MRKLLWNFAKVTGAGATIFAIAWQISVGGADLEVDEATADIGTWTTTEAMFGGDFAKSVAAGGMVPRAYEMNGNLVHFGVAYVKESPDEVLDHYQEQFVRAGINEKKFTEVPDGKFTRTLQDARKNTKPLSDEEMEYNTAMLTGGVVPVAKRPGYVAMGGVVPKKRLESVNEIVDDWVASGEHSDMARQIDGFRFIDAQQWPGQIGSRVTSVWADSGFDARKMSNPQQEGVAPILETPVCMGCNVGMQMRSLDPNEKYRIGHFNSRKAPRNVLDFYTRAMANRGFETGDAHKAVELARRYLGPEVPSGNVLTYKRGGVESLVAIFDNSKTGETSVMVVETY